MYTLVVDALGDDTAQYQLVLYEVPAADVQAALLGETLSGEIETPGVTDRWEFTIAANQEVFLDVQAITPVAGVLVPRWTSRCCRRISAWCSRRPSVFRIGRGRTDGLRAGDVDRCRSVHVVVDALGDETAQYQLALYEVPARTCRRRRWARR